MYLYSSLNFTPGAQAENVFAILIITTKKLYWITEKEFDSQRRYLVILHILYLSRL